MFGRKKIAELRRRLAIVNDLSRKAEEARDKAKWDADADRLVLRSDLQQERDRANAAVIAAESAVRNASAALSIADECRQRAEDAELRLEEEKISRAEKRLEGLIQSRVICHLGADGHSLEGFLSGVYSDSVVLSHAKYLMPEEGAEERLEGDQVIPVDKISWVQELSTVKS